MKCVFLHIISVFIWFKFIFKMRYLFIISIFSVFLFSCSSIEKNIKKAGEASSKGDLEKAVSYYQKAYQLDNNSYKANLGLGVTLADFMERYEEALPYLEKAEKLSPKDTSYDLIYALAKTYHYYERFDDALYNYRRMKRAEALVDDNNRFQAELNQKIDNCLYAQSHTENADPKNYFVSNLGSKINTKMPEYVPAFTEENQFLFTSRRKDDKTEKIDPHDGKYKESMYVSKLENNQFSTPERYTLPDLKAQSKFRKGHESVVSVNNDVKRMFIFRDGKLYDIDIAERTSKDPKKLARTINFGSYQNHACITKDGKYLYFTSDDLGGMGGNDIYKATKKEDGTWGEPENLGSTINTVFDEDGPFISEDGNILYFSSTGHQGFGGFDIFKSEFVNGQWSEPVNLGKPMNSVVNDIFLINLKSGEGYFSSNRRGGKGDMDIYKMVVPNLNKECDDKDSRYIDLLVSDVTEMKKNISFEINGPFKGKELMYSWTISDSANLNKPQQFHYTFQGSGQYPVMIKVATYCDTCLAVYMACKQVTVDIKVPVKPDTFNIDNIHGELTKDQLLALGFDVTPVHFDLNKPTIREDAIQILDKNIEVLKKYTSLNITLTGHADIRGLNLYNKILSHKRAEHVKDYLVKHGIDKKRIIKLIAKGEEEPLVPCADEKSCTEEQHQQNRRVEFSISK